MKAKNFLSAKAISHLRGIDLTTKAEELATIKENIEEDLFHYLLRLTVQASGISNFSSILSIGRSLFAYGAKFNHKKVNAKYQKAFASLIEDNRFELLRELACGAYNLHSEDMRVNKDDAFAQSRATRKLLHKAWLHSKWEGDTISFGKLLKSTKVSAKKLKAKSIQVITTERNIYRQYNNCFWFERSHNGLPEGYLPFCRLFAFEELKILSVGIGSFLFNEKKVPVFNKEYMEGIYVVAQNHNEEKHLIQFPHVDALVFADELNVNAWILERICTPEAAHFAYRLKGVKIDNKGVADHIPLIEVYGTMPFYLPNIVR